MAKAALMCPYYDRRAVSDRHRDTLRYVEMNSGPTRHANIKAMRLSKSYIRCPECGRRMKPRISFCDDGCCVLRLVPPHKKKGWWKKKKVRKLEKKKQRR
jgi:hypothetical protein